MQRQNWGLGGGFVYWRFVRSEGIAGDIECVVELERGEKQSYWQQTPDTGRMVPLKAVILISSGLE